MSHTAMTDNWWYNFDPIFHSSRAMNDFDHTPPSSSEQTEPSAEPRKDLHIRLGHWNTLKVIREKAFGVFLEGGQYVDILLPKRYIPEGCKVGDELNVFIYLDSNDDVIATTETPKAELGQFACLKAEEVNPVGAFLDWGLPKQLLVPFSEQKIRMLEGKYYVVYIYQEQWNWRIVASSKTDKFLDPHPGRYKTGQEVSLLMTDKTDIGFMAIINNSHQGVVFHNDIHQPVRMGQKLTGYIKRVRPDGKIDLSLNPLHDFKSPDFGDQIIASLKKHDGFLPLHDKSTPDEINRFFPVSKRIFKMAIGGLYKTRRITIEKNGIRLTGDA